MKPRMDSLLREVPLFSGLSEEQLARLVADTPVEEYAGGVELYSVGEPAESFLLVLSGRLKVYMLSPDGREHVLHSVGPGQLAAEGAVFAQQTYPASAMATERTVVARFYRERLFAMLRDDAELSLALIAGLSRRLREFVLTIGDLSLRDVTTRLARFLLENAEEGVCKTPGTKTLLAAQLGTVLEPLSRSFRKLREAGIIEDLGHEVRILDDDALQAMILGVHPNPPDLT